MESGVEQNASTRMLSTKFHHCGILILSLQEMDVDSADTSFLMTGIFDVLLWNVLLLEWNSLCGTSRVIDSTYSTPPPTRDM